MHNNSKTSGSKWSSVWVYFVIAFGVTWLIDIALALSRINMQTASGSVLLSLAVLGPATAAISLTYLTQDKKGIHEYWQRITDVRRISLRWYLVIFLLPPLFSASLHCWISRLAEEDGHSESRCNNFPPIQFI